MRIEPRPIEPQRGALRLIDLRQAISCRGKGRRHALRSWV